MRYYKFKSHYFANFKINQTYCLIAKKGFKAQTDQYTISILRLK